MDPDKMVLERAFELASSGKCRSIDDITKDLSKEGYYRFLIEGPNLRKQLNELIKKARPLQ